MENKKNLNTIAFLNKNEQREIIALFISTSTIFFSEFKNLYKSQNLIRLEKICHNYGSSLIAFNLEDCIQILEKISNELNKKNIEDTYSPFLILEDKVNSFINDLNKYL